MEDLKGIIKELKTKLDRARKKWGISECDDYLLTLLTYMKEVYYIQIHKKLSILGSEEAEEEIRSHIRDIIKDVLPVFDYKFKEIREIIIKESGHRKKDSIEKRKDAEELFGKYYNLYDDFFALTAYRSMEQFALYMEMDARDNEKVWKNNLGCFRGFWYYGTRAVLDRKIRFIEKQLPTGYGKSYSDIVMTSFIFGINPNDDVMKVTGNPQMVGDLTGKLIKYMTSARYSKVFPWYGQFQNDAGNMFSICQQGGGQSPGRLLIRDSNKGTSFLMINKETPIDGARFRWQFYDDITRSADKNNITAHDKDIARFDDSWYKRRYSDDVCVIAGGTTYSTYDFLSTLKNRYGGKDAVISSVNKYTKINESKRSVFVSVPKLDENDESTFPARYSTKEAREQRARDYYTFMAMEQQDPVPIEGCLFSWDYLQTYEAIPHEGENESCWAVIDPARKGKNYVTMVICIKIGELHYLKDCVYELAIMEKVIPLIIDKIIRHHITRLHVETNTETSFKRILNTEFQRNKINYCEISEVYSLQKKEEKILNASASIKNNMVFPAFELYAPSSPMGKFMKGITSYNPDSKNSYDDAPDAIAMYNDKFISQKTMTSKVKILDISR